MKLPTLIRVIYAVNFSIIMSLTPLLYILNHPTIFKIGFSEDTVIPFIPFYPLTFIAFKSIARFGNGLALCNNYLFGKEYHKIVGYFIIYLIYTLIIEGYQVCFANEIDINIFAFMYICRQYLYSSIDFSLDQLDINYNQSYRVIGFLLLLIPLYGIMYPTWLLLSLKLLYMFSIIGLGYCIYLINLHRELLDDTYLIDKLEEKKINGRISVNKFIWIFIMLLLVSYIDGAGDAIATEKLWNSKDIKYFVINMFVKIFASLMTFPPIQKKCINQSNNTSIITRLMIFRFLLLMSIKWIYFQEILFFSQCSIDIFIGTIFMNNYLDKNKKLFWNSKSTSTYYMPASFAYFVNENIPPLIKIILVYNLINIGKTIDIGNYFIIPIMITAVGSMKLIPIIQKKIQ